MKKSVSKALFLGSFAFAAPFAPVVDLGYARYIGTTNETSQVTTFYGLPYARPPVGALRWAAPQPIDAGFTKITSPVVNASMPGPMCYQALTPAGAVPWNVIQEYLQILPPQSEDCLRLNVKVPTSPVNASLPVLVTIRNYGGGYDSGSTVLGLPCEALVNAAKGGLMCVEIQYRLGFFGFLAGSGVREHGDLNVGLLDQRAALQWIQRHVKTFGGDPNRVTIWGNSAGGGSVTYQLTAGGGADPAPFSAAIIEYPWWTPLLSPSIQESQYQSALSLTNCTTLSCLRIQPPSTLQFVNQRVLNSSYPGPGFAYGLFYWGPVIDNTFIREHLSRAFAAGRFHAVPSLLDRDALEGFAFSNASLTAADELTDARNVFPAAGPSFFRELLDRFYPAAAFAAPFDRRQTWFGDFVVNCPTRYMARGIAHGGAPVWKLVFDAGTRVHGATGPFVASQAIGFPDAGNRTLAEVMARWWISFAVTGDPNALRERGAPLWPEYGGGGEEVQWKVMQVEPADIYAEEDPDGKARCDFFEANSLVVGN